MSNSVIQCLAVATTVGAAVAAGVFFAFSTFIMPALGRLEPAQGISAMQAINVAAPNAWFMTILFGSAAGALVVAGFSVVRGDGSAVLTVVGCALYLVCIATTIAYHVPRNDALALVDPADADAAAAWRDYLAGWTLWNHVRTISALASAAVFARSLLS